MEKPRILISGVGRIGEAIAQIIAPQEHIEIALWDIDSTKIDHSFSAAQLAATADVIFLCTPSGAVRQFIESVRQEISRDVIIVSLIKGLDPQSGATMWELLEEIMPPGPAVVTLGGPMLSGELLQGNPAFGVAGCDIAVFPRVAELFHGTLLKVIHSTDPAGVSSAGVLKNMYALGLGMAAAIHVGDNALGKLTVQALHEMSSLIEQLGGTKETVFGLAGMGDLIATGFSKHSRNRTVGRDLVTTGTTAVPSEGLLSLPLLLKRLPEDLAAYPLLGIIKNVVIERQPARELFQELL